MKKFLTGLIILFGITLISSSALADCETGGYKVERVVIEDEREDEGISFFSEPSVPFEEFIYNRILNRIFDYEDKGVIDVSAYRLGEDDFFTRLDSVTLANPELMIYTSIFGYYTNTSGIVTGIAPKYIYESKSESDAEYAKMDKWIQNFVDSVDEDFTEEEKVLATYYFVADNVEYSKGEMFESKDPMIFTSYSAFKNGHCVCQGYSTLMCGILERLGVECGLIPSETIEHIWNYVVIDGENYHIDITWDDIDDSKRKVVYDNFLLSDSMRARRIYYATGKKNALWYWIGVKITCSSTEFEDDDYIWNWDEADLYDFNYDGRSWVGKNYFNLSGVVEKVCVPFGGVRAPEDSVIMSEITDNGKLVFWNDTDSTINRIPVYIAEYNENNNLTKTKLLMNISLNEDSCVFVELTRPKANKISIMLLDSKTYAPLGRNVIME